MTPGSVPMLPVLYEFPLRSSAGGLPSILDIKNKIYVSSGKAGIYQVLKHIKIEPKDEVMLPAYLCESMLEAVLESGATPVFYKINSDLSVDRDDLLKRIKSESKVLLVTHFFGLYQDLRSMREICDRHGLIMIEDCAHSFFGKISGYPIGYFGDYSIASLPKFFPVFKGGVLASSKHRLDDITLQKRRVLNEIKGIYNVFELSARYRRSWKIWFVMLAPVMLNRLIRHIRLFFKVVTRGFRERNLNRSEGKSRLYIYFDRSTSNHKANISSVYICRHSDPEKLIAIRRRNFEYLRNQLAGVTGISSIPAVITEEFVPYVYPLVVHQPDCISAFRREGIPFWMWENIHNEVCENSKYYSKRLIQLPCHQSLNEKDLDTIISCLKRVLQIEK